MADRQALRVRAFAQEDEPSVLALLDQAFGRWPAGIESMQPAEFLRWKHLRGPFGCSLLYVGEVDGEVAGFAAYMPWLFKAAGQTVRTMRAVDFAVDPASRRLGVMLAIRRRAAASPGGAAFLWGNPNEPMRRGGVKLGRRESGRIPHFTRFCGRPGQTTLRLAARRAPASAQPPIDAPSASEVLADGDYVASVLVGIVDRPQCLVTAKDVDYLRWRYGHLSEYRALRAGAASARGGIAIFRVRDYGALWVADICELLLEQGWSSVGRDLIHQVRDAAATDCLACSFYSRREAASLGFMKATRGTKLVSHALERDLPVDPGNPRSWALSRGDLELL